MFGKKTLKITWILAAAVALGPLATDMYLPAFPQLREIFGADAAEVQWTLSAFMIGLACFQLIVGPVSDRLGRKVVMIGGLILFAVSSALAMTSTSVVELTILRLLQSLGVCTALVIPRAIIRDLFEREEAAKQLSRMGAIMGLAPAIAPIIGGFITVYVGWPGVFAFLTFYALLLILLSHVKVKESLPEEARIKATEQSVIESYLGLIRSPVFLSYAITSAFCFGGFFAYISASSFIFIEVLGVSQQFFGFYFGFVVIGFITGNLLVPYLSRMKGIDGAIKIGTAFAITGGSLLFVFAMLGYANPIAIVFPMVIYNVGVGIVGPQCQAAAIHPFPEKAGAASALIGFIVLGTSALTGLIVAEFYQGTQMPMVTTVFVMSVAAFLCNRLTTNHRQALTASKA